MNEATTIQLQKETRERLKAFGDKDDTYDAILIKLMNNQSTPKKIDALRNLTEQEQSIKHQLLELMREWPNRTWLIQEFTSKVMNWLNTSYKEAKEYVISLLEKIPEIEKVYDVKFRNFGNGSGYRLISKNSII